MDAIADTEGEVYVLDLTKNIGAESFKLDAGRIDQIAQVAVQLLLARINNCPVKSVVLPVSIVNGTTA